LFNAIELGEKAKQDERNDEVQDPFQVVASQGLEIIIIARQANTIIRWQKSYQIHRAKMDKCEEIELICGNRGRNISDELL